MKSFTEFIIEAKMTRSEALELLGIDTFKSPQELKKAYKKASIKNHPDKGGSDAVMKQINAAFSLLQTSGASESANMDWETVKKQHKDRAEAWTAFVTLQLDKFFDVEEYTTFLSEHVETQLSSERIVRSGIGLYTNATYKWKSLDNKIVFSLELSFRDESGEAGLTDASTGVSLGEIGYSTEVLINRKKIKMTQANYKFGAKAKNIFSDPKVAFPKAKIKKAMKDSNKAVKRADYMLTFKNELKASVSGNVIRIPLPHILDDSNSPLEIVMERSTFMGAGQYTIHDIRGNRGRIMDKGQYGYGSCFESKDQTVLSKLVDIMQGAQKLKDLDKVIKYLAKNCKDLSTWSGDFL